MTDFLAASFGQADDQDPALTKHLRRYLDDIATSIDGWIWETNEKLEFTYFSSNVEKMTGVPPAWHYGKTREQIGTPEALDPRLWRAHLDLLQARQPFRDFCFLRRGPNGDRWMSTSGVPVFDRNGIFQGYRGIGRDVTTEILTKARGEQLSAAIEELNDSFVVWDDEDRIIASNRAFRDINRAFVEATRPGTSLEQHIRAGLAVDAYPSARGREEAWIAERLDRHRNPGESFEIQRQDGRWLLLREVRLPEGGTATIGVDISERKRMEEEAQAAADRFAQLVESSSDWVWELNAELAFTSIIIGEEQRAFTDPKRMLGRHVSEVFRAEIVGAEAAQQIAEMLAEQRSFRNLETCHRLREGTRWFRSFGRPIFDANARFAGYRGTASDITNLKDAERYTQRLANALAEAQEVFALWDPDDRLVFHNERFLDVNSSIANDVRLGMPFAELMEAQVAAGMYAIPHNMSPQAYAEMRVKKHRQPGRAIEVECRGAIWYQLRGHRLTDGSILSVGLDISERKRAEKAQKEAREEAEIANRSKSDFLANMSHELRTPLNAIIGFSEIMAQEVLGPMEHDRYLEYAEDINNSGQHLLGIINEILDLSRVISGKAVLDEESVDLIALVGESMRLLASRAAEAVVHLEPQVDHDLPKIRGDRRKLKQVVLNLLSNAVKFSNEGGVVRIGAHRERDGRVQIFVEDNGIGISKQDLALVLVPFGQAGRVAERANEGTGLGLPLSQAFTELHQGELLIESELGVGTKVTMILPSSRVL